MERLGRKLALVLPVRILVALVGTLGAGKTRLVRALAETWGIESEEIASPTFVLCREYHGSRIVYHLDAYRITEESELIELGFEELLAAEATVLLEWADRVPRCLPSDYLKLDIEANSEDSRIVTLTEVGRCAGIIDRLSWPSEA